MRVSATKTLPRVERNQYLTSKRIKGYGDGNDYPQKILEIIASSGTGKTCFDTYIKFVRGSGFTDKVFNDLIVNANNERASSLLSKFAKDLKSFNGFACLVKYDFNALPYAYYNIPFEHCRIEIDGKKKYTGRIAVHPDWTNLAGLTFRMEDVKFISKYDPEAVAEQIAEVGGPGFYFGQVFYYTDDGDFEYPICPFDPIITDMLTEESVSTVKHRNAKFNFLPSGVLVRKGIKPRTLADGTVNPTDRYNEEQANSAAEIKRMQGDMNTSKIWVVDIDSDEEMPQFIDFTAKNYDRQYEVTEKTVQENIGRMFKLPPVLRGIDVGNGFGSDLLTNAYDYINSVTSDERDDLERAFMDLFKFYPVQFTDFSIKPKSYIPSNTTMI